MIKKIVLAIASFLLLGHQAVQAQCVNDTIFTDVLYLIDNSGSIDDSEFVSFSNIITTSIADLRANCSDAQVAVAHYGGFEGKGTAIEYPFSTDTPIPSVSRQFCLARNASDNCTDGGGDDLNFAIGNILDSLQSGALTHDTSNNLSLVIFTDAFGFETDCRFPFCSLILPTTNIDILKSQYGVDVTVVGMSAQAEETALALYSSPGGTYNGGLYAPACPTSFDGCTLPRKYVEVEFNSDPDALAAIVTSFVSCSIIINTGLVAEAGADQSICSDLSQSATLTAVGDMGTAPYNYSWSNGSTTSSITVSPTDTTTYFVTISDANTCIATDSVTVYAAPCCDNLMANAGLDTTICNQAGSSASLMASASGSGTMFSYTWDNGLGSGATQSVSPTTTTTYTVTAIDNIGCTDTDQVTVTVEACCTGFSVSAGADRTICGDLGESTTLSASITGGVGPFLTVWNNGIGVENNPIVSPTTTTTYTVTITDANGCMTTDQVTIGVDMCGPDCEPDTTFTDVIFLIDNSGSIDDNEFAQFENIIVASLAGIRNSCNASRRSVVHYGGSNGTSTLVEYAFGQVPEITNINRQYCTDRNSSNICVGGGGDDLNNAIGDIMAFLEDGSLNRDPKNNLGLVILTDAFGFGTNCQQPNCSLILPTTNIDAMKANYDMDVSVVGVSSQAEEVLLGIYASPGGTFNGQLFQAECASSFDGCQLPRKYVQIEFDTPPQQVADMITDFVSCEVEITPALVVDAGEDQMICNNFGESATLTATVSFGTAPFIYEWNQGLGTMQSVTVTPTVATEYIVTVTDANTCTQMDTVVVSPQMCFECTADAGDPLPPTEVCIKDGQAFLPTESNTGTIIPMGFEEVFFLTNADLKIVDYSIGFRNFIVSEPGLYRIHTLIAEVSNPLSEDYFDLNIIRPGTSDLFVIVNCIENHDICADFDFPGRVIQVLGENDMMCMEMENSISLCWDGVDNDGDGLADCADPDCIEFVTCKENTLLACNDLTDNDGDGLVDCYDSDCFGFTLCFERGDDCNDGIDNDGDGMVDCADSSCDGAAACLENSPFTCVDGRDNDGDGLVDCADPECQAFIVCAEYSDAACKDGEDNDFDGLIDCKDPDCRGLLPDYCSPFENTVFKCQDGRDNDDDGLLDCDDPDCQTAQLIDLMANLDRILEVTNATCNGGDDGIIRFYGIATDPSFQYSIDGGMNFISSTQFTALAPRAYVVAVKSALGCIEFIDINLERDGCPEICNNNIDDDGDGLVDCQDDGCTTVDPHTVSIVNMIPSECPDYNNGSFEVAGLPSDMMYTLDGVNYQNSPVFTGLEALSYNLGYKDANGCYPGVVVTVEGSPDADGDGVCDALDTCPGEDDWIIGTACDDGDPCTTNDIYSTVCDCAGTMEDSDGDGVCNAMDQCPTGDDSLIGTDCDDGDPCTINDIYTTDCNCAGVYSDSDGDGICDAEDNCPSGDDTLIGTACDDGNACTINDVYTVACNCEGVFQDSDGDGICDAEDNCSSGDDSLIGTSCDDGDPCTVDDVYNTACNCEGVFQDSDSDGVCDAEDLCPDQGLAIGTLCDDNNPDTEGDVITADCNCIGTQRINNSIAEVCNDGVDNDMDGLVDCEDSDCQNSLIVEFSIVPTSCDVPTGSIELLSPVLDNFSFISELTSGTTYPIEYDSLSVGEYELYAFKNCDTTIQRFTVEEIENCNSQSVCDEPHPDYATLMNIYTSTNGESWTDRDGWSEGANGVSCDPCNWNGSTWFGIDCSDGRVSAINLRGINLSGSIPESISQLSELKILRMDDNSIGGVIPNSISQLTKLTDLALFNNNLEGSIPVGISQLSNLKNFAIQNNALVGEIPAELGLLTLQNGAFQLHGNQLSGTIPPELGNLSSQNLTLSNNNLTGEIPEELFNNQNLKRVDFNDNNLEGQIPSSLGDLTRLEFAHFHNNNLSGCFDQNLWSLCEMGQSPSNAQRGYNFLGNDLLPWSGDFSQFCAEENQVGASCDDGDSTTSNDEIAENCSCIGAADNSGQIEICNNGIDDDGDGMVDCEDGDCCDESNCEREVFDYEITNSECNTNTGKVRIVNPDSMVHYFIIPTNMPDSLGSYDISTDTLPIGDYILIARGVCDTMELSFTIEYFADCDTTEICNNNIDDDGDGLIDCEDGDCSLSNVPVEVMDSFCGESNGFIRIIDYDSTLQYSLQTDSSSLIDTVIIINAPDGFLDSIPVGSYTLFTSNNCNTTIIENIVIEEIVCKENCNNGIDDDGDGLIDCEDGDCSGECEAFPAAEICNNGIDDDGDGMVDCEDGDCMNDEIVDVKITNIINETCDQSNGSFTGSGFPFGTTWSIDGINYQEDSIFTNLDSGSYVVTYRDADGCYEGPTVDIDLECESAGATAQSSALNITVMLQGACSPEGGPMSTELNDGGYLPGQQPATYFGVATPAGQPFNQAPWFYEGSEGSNDKSNGKSNEDLYEPTVVDWVLVSLRDGAKKSDEVWRAAGLLHNDGYIEFQVDSDPLPKAILEGYYVVIEHRNHLPVMSADRILVIDGQMSYDFTKQNSFKSLLGVGQIQDAYGQYMMIAGNGELVIELSSDIDINTRDLTLWIQNNGANSSYFLEDYDMNGDINIKDRIMWEKNNGLFTTLETKE